VYEILLSEIFGVPVSIEMGVDDKKSTDQIGSFYDTEGRFVLSDNVYPAHHLVEADRVQGVCSLTDKPCSHLMPEVWYVSGRKDIKSAQGMVVFMVYVCVFY
jgi:hypothetical protein